MKRTRGGVLALALCLAILSIAGRGLVMSATDSEQVIDLSPWIGTNESFWTILQDPAADKVFSEIAKYAPGYDLAMVRKCMEKLYRFNFDVFRVIDGRTVCFDDGVVAEYDLIGVLEVEANQYKPTWYIFKTESKDAIEFGVEYLLMMPYHGDGEGLGHCHLRYGNQGFEYLTTDPSIANWWPTAFRPEEADKLGRESILEGLVRSARMLATMLPPVK
ncbi:MAG TPA: hypothetical protein DCL63_03640 [Firmicutes bacterium]|nr:hypothetical protein [Bacillota bacterium]